MFTLSFETRKKLLEIIMIALTCPSTPYDNHCCHLHFHRFAFCRRYVTRLSTRLVKAMKLHNGCYDPHNGPWPAARAGRRMPSVRAKVKPRVEAGSGIAIREGGSKRGDTGERNRELDSIVLYCLSRFVLGRSPALFHIYIGLSKL